MTRPLKNGEKVIRWSTARIYGPGDKARQNQWLRAHGLSFTEFIQILQDYHAETTKRGEQPFRASTVEEFEEWFTLIRAKWEAAHPGVIKEPKKRRPGRPKSKP